jgi:ribonucleoside-triphosphate reductase
MRYNITRGCYKKLPLIFTERSFLMKIKVIKKDGTIQPFSFDTIKKAVTKSADRAMETLNDNDWKQLEKIVTKHIKERFKDEIKVIDIHRIVEKSLEDINKPTAKSYRDFRNYKTESVEILNEIYKRDHNIRYIGDNENSNSDSTLVSTKRSLIYGEVNKELYKKFFLNVNELDAIKKGYIYIHDMSARRDSINCCLANVTEIFKGGFEMGNIHYNEPKTLDVAFDVLGDVIFSMSAQQYGGYTVPEIDTFLLPYLEKSYNKYIEEYFDIAGTATIEDLSTNYYQERAKEFAKSKIQRDLEQGFQGLEYKLNTVGSSRGDYPFVTVTFGLETSEFGKMISKACLTTRMKGQGKEGFKRPVLFPKLVFLYDEEIHGEGKISEDLFNLGVECSKLSMYPKKIGA